MGLFDKIKKAANKVGDAFSGGEKEAKKALDTVEKEINKVRDAAIREIQNVKDGSIKSLQNERRKAGMTFKDYKNESVRTLENKKKDLSNKLDRDIKDLTKRAEKELKVHTNELIKDAKEVGDRIEEYHKMAIDTGAPDILLEVAVPKSISIEAKVVGNGIKATWNDNEDVAQRIIRGDYELDIMYEFIPDAITVSCGVDLALVLSVNVGASLTYDLKDDILEIIEYIKSKT